MHHFHGKDREHRERLLAEIGSNDKNIARAALHIRKANN